MPLVDLIRSFLRVEYAAILAVAVVVLLFVRLFVGTGPDYRAQDALNEGLMAVLPAYPEARFTNKLILGKDDARMLVHEYWVLGEEGDVAGFYDSLLKGRGWRMDAVQGPDDDGVTTRLFSDVRGNSVRLTHSGRSIATPEARDDLDTISMVFFSIWVDAAEPSASDKEWASE